MRSEFLTHLRCPYCGGDLAPSFRHPAEGAEIESAILACDCGEFPLLGGVPIFLREGRVDVMRQTVDAPAVYGPEVRRLVELIRKGSSQEALRRLLSVSEGWVRRGFAALELLPSRGRGRLRRFLDRAWDRQSRRGRGVLAEPSAQGSARQAFAAYARVTAKPELFHHFFHRFGQPRHLSSLAFAWSLKTGDRPCLDLGCGFGHTLHAWTRGRPDGLFVGLDRNFLGLYVAKRWVAPAAEYVCARGDERLPFADATFGGILCADAFHYLLRKRSAAAELQRLIAPDGAVILTHVGNARQPPREGYELDAEGYARLFEGLEVRVLPDREALESYLEGRLPPLDGRSADPAKFPADAKWLSILAARPGALPVGGDLGGWPHGLGRLRINPLYRVTKTDAGASLELALPTEFFAFENSDLRRYMPERIDVPMSVLEDVEAQRRTAQVEALIARSVVLGFPERYG